MLRFNYMRCISIGQTSSDFNTSYVTVQPGLGLVTSGSVDSFQYILCYGSTIVKFGEKQQKTWISIHPMLRFNKALKQYCLAVNLNFNTSYVTVQRDRKFSLIKHIYNFNTSYVTVQQQSLPRGRERIEFQYILCYGSTLLYISVKPPFYAYFNTSYVTVQHAQLKAQLSVMAFQYILCYGSTQKKQWHKLT